MFRRAAEECHSRAFKCKTVRVGVSWSARVPRGDSAFVIRFIICGGLLRSRTVLFKELPGTKGRMYQYAFHYAAPYSGPRDHTEQWHNKGTQSTKI